MEVTFADGSPVINPKPVVKGVHVAITYARNAKAVAESVLNNPDPEVEYSDEDRAVAKAERVLADRILDALQ